MDNALISAQQITIADLYTLISQPNDLFFLDVRNRDEYESRKIEGPYTPQTLNIPYFEFLEDESNFEQVPTDRDIVVICAKGGSSDFIAEMLRERGVNAANLIGGMIDWGNHYVFRTVVETASYKIVQIDRVARGCLSHIIISQGEAAIIDPLRHIEHYSHFLQNEGATLKFIFDTHAHADHISGGPALSQQSGAPYHLHPYDGIHPFDMLPPKISYEMLRDGQSFMLGDLNIRVIHTPGHTLGQVNFLVSEPGGESYLFSGDTLFLDSFGRPDLGGQGEGWAPIVYETLFGILRAQVPDDALLLPGHYARLDEANADGLFMKRFADLWQENSALRFEDRTAFVEFVLGNLPHMPQEYIQIKRVNTGLAQPDEDEASTLELGRNICALSGAYK